MGILATPIAPHPIMEEQPTRRLHPFFTSEREHALATPQPHSHNGSGVTEPRNEPTSVTHPEHISIDGAHSSDRPQKRRRTDGGDDGACEAERRVRMEATASSDSASLPQITPNNQAETIPVSLTTPNAVTDLQPAANPSLIQSAAGTATTGPNETPTEKSTPGSDTKAKKLIKFNPKTGTLGSPPQPKASEKTSAKTSTKRGRPRKKFIASMKYGGDDAATRARIGEQISRILAPKPDNVEPAGPSNVPTQPAATPKPAHPFFSKKSKKSPPSGSTPSTPQAIDRPKPPRQVVFSSTPCSPKRSRPAASKQGPQFGIKSLGLKVPGATLPLWPPQDMAHVRGLAHESGGSLVPSQALLQRKAKGHSVGIADEESILTFLTRSTDVATVQASIQSDIDNADHILPPPQGLRLPLKHFESGPKVQRRMRPRLKTYQRPLRVVESSDDELGPRVHPIIRRLFNSLRTSLSAYDRSDCENSSWAQKYAPQTTAEVLQPGKEGSLLREWLLSLTVDSVDTGADPAAREKPLVDAKARGKKKRKRALEGFIVDSDDEADELDEVSDGEDSWASPVDRGLRSVIRHGDIKAKARDARLTNAVVISGPHGCGKTAAVYAIAKELDFEVFEINASSRRSGKDVLERVGDMTRNHLVRHHADEAQAEEDQTAEDVKSGKQGTMTSFFKPKGAAKTPNVKSASPKTSPKPQGPKSQKQSLILLEEVDILYEEDKQFWVTISSLIAQSKRPFIMTCNDETLLPFALLNLHGIFRFNPPPADLAVDAMLLVAANEGHVLERRPVEELYETRGRDLRASLTELNYWCQIGVGDRRGGMDWFYLRWPKGSDVDENGDVVRVISESTYQSGMGWFGDSARGDKQDEEEMVRESWEAWGVGCDELLMPDGSMGAPCSVSEYADFMDSMSSADVLSSGAFGKAYEEPLDATLPDTTARAKDDYIIGRTLLDAPQLTTYCPLTLTTSTAVKTLARSCLSPPPPPITEKQAIKNIRTTLASPRGLDRTDMSLAFDPIAASDKPSLSGHLDPSVFDRTMGIIMLDVAPFVRGIVAADDRRRKERLKLGTLLSEGAGPGAGVEVGAGAGLGLGLGQGVKRRKTRSAMSALEGGERGRTRGERYFAGDVNGYLVLRTGGEWQGAVEDVMGEMVAPAGLEVVGESGSATAESGE